MWLCRVMIQIIVSSDMCTSTQVARTARNARWCVQATFGLATDNFRRILVSVSYPFWLVFWYPVTDSNPGRNCLNSLIFFAYVQICGCIFATPCRPRLGQTAEIVPAAAARHSRCWPPSEFRGQLYYQPEQCTTVDGRNVWTRYLSTGKKLPIKWYRVSWINSIIREILQNYHTFTLLDPRKMGNLIIPVLLHFISDWEIKTIHDYSNYSDFWISVDSWRFFDCTQFLSAVVRW